MKLAVHCFAASIASPGMDSSVTPRSRNRAFNPAAIEAAKQWTANFNPRPITAVDFEVLYRGAL